MNEDPVRVDRIDLQSAFPVLRMLQSVRAGFHPLSLLSALAVLILIRSVHVWLLPSGVLSEKMTGVRSASFGIRSSGLPGLIRFFSGVQMSAATAGGGALCLLAIGFIGPWIARRACPVPADDSALNAPRRMTSGQGAIRILVSSVIAALLGGCLWAGCRAAWWFFPAGRLVTDTILFVTTQTAILCGMILLFGWLLSLSAVSLDSCKGSDALSRGISYVLSRPCLSVVLLTLLLGLISVESAALDWILARTGAMTVHIVPDASAVGNFRNHATIVIGLFVQSLQLSTLLSGMAVGYRILRQAEDGVPWNTPG